MTGSGKPFVITGIAVQLCCSSFRFLYYFAFLILLNFFVFLILRTLLCSVLSKLGWVVARDKQAGLSLFHSFIFVVVWRFRFPSCACCREPRL